MRKFQTLKLFQFHKEKTCWTENWWSSGIMSNFWGEFFYVLGGKKNFLNFFKNILATALKSYIKWLLYIKKFIIENFWKTWKNWNYLHKILFPVYSICYTRGCDFTAVGIYIFGWNFIEMCLVRPSWPCLVCKIRLAEQRANIWRLCLTFRAEDARTPSPNYCL